MSDEIINSPLSEIEFLVFSSHKTATQTITKSLNASGTKARHCHTLDNIDIPEGDFRSCLDAYRRQNMRALGIISVFRDPLDRLVSSFFQSASRWLSPSELIEQQPERSLINRLSFDALGKVFCDYCLQFNGFGESLEIICKELGIAVADLRFSPSENLGANDRDSCHLFLMRFDVMSDDQALGPLLERITGTTIALSSENVSAGKWYGNKYQAFKAQLKLPVELIKMIYNERRELMNLFYPGELEAILAQKIDRYGL